MTKELFGAIRDNYNHASENLNRWHNRQNLIIKVLTFFWIFPASLIMKIIGFIFSLGVFLDKISLWLQSKRNYVIDAISNSTNQLYYNKTAYIFSPIKVLFLAPLGLFFGLVPKWSSTLVTFLDSDIDPSIGVDHGYFTKLAKSYLSFSKQLFSNINKHGKLFILPALVVSIFIVPIFIIISIVFFILIILDYIGWIVSFIRKFVVSSSASMARNSGKNFGGVITMPIFLTLFVPVYIVLLLIPKIATHEANS